jgi:outer membrane lipoprotein-sorting protein
MVQKKKLKILFPLAVFFILIFLSAISSRAAEFSADMIQKMQGQTQTGKVFIKGKKMRMEMDTPGNKMVHIMLPEQKKTIMLMTKEKMYMEMTAANNPGSSPSSDKEELEKIATVKQLGTETINGYLCDKLQVIFHDKNQGTSTQWVSKKLNFPIKMVSQTPHGEAVTEYQNIKEGSVPDSSFIIPPGYQQMPMAGMGGHGMPQGIR